MARGGVTGAGRGNGGRSAANSGVNDGGNQFTILDHSNFERSPAEDSTSKSLVNSSGNFRNRREKPVCSHCGIVGHVVDKCYKLHGFPPGFKFRNHVSNGKPVVSQTSANSDISEDTSVVHSKLSPNQCQQIIAFLSSQLQHTTTTHQTIEDQQPTISNFTDSGTSIVQSRSSISSPPIQSRSFRAIRKPSYL
ncbi:hypothetical protein LWI29_033682 [Acer saccharum]|uniref:Uncharacterized protein n=1 Tax=Acer saccharum TaxID=4024 RepID=A0AA39W852_ACESA|nr:hypothetical protein LWI29_033682 [Acer saccharum]